MYVQFHINIGNTFDHSATKDCHMFFSAHGNISAALLI